MNTIAVPQTNIYNFQCEKSEKKPINEGKYTLPFPATISNTIVNNKLDILISNYAMTKSQNFKREFYVCRIINT